ncbi:MAG TPA: helix-turn-helix transcriptional regulator [Firmicutes bacterium]|nr:helix-turn-helix transcriptional regulator [Bacillota bacterium]
MFLKKICLFVSELPALTFSDIIDSEEEVPLSNLGERLKELRHIRGITQRDLARDLGVAPATIAQYETGKRMPDVTTLDTLAGYFNVTVDYLIGRSDYPHLPDTSKIDGALEADPELLEFWNQLKKREDLQLLARQVKDIAPEDIRKIIRVIKAIEDEEEREDG